MQINYHRTIFLFSLSAILHLLIFIAIGIIFPISSQTFLLGSHDTPIISTYIDKIDKTDKTVLFTHDNMANKTSFSTSIKNRTLTLKATTNKDLAISTKKNVAKKLSRPTSTTKASATTSHGQETEPLLALLHAAIQQQQHYPASALEMERQGRTTVAFKLLMDGSVQHIRIAKSSGTVSLDEAALAAVRDAAPFKGVNAYLHEPQEYNIDVVFELT